MKDAPKITGLITEYNPFHNGHLHHLNESRRLTGADYCIALMSGSFVQRGAPAVFDKYLRARMALLSGVDLVLELPVSFSTASAREFAAYGVALFTALGADGICFGSECGQIAPLQKAAALLTDEPEESGARLRAFLKDGMTYPEARGRALLSFLGPEEQGLLESPNNILGIEYLRAALEQESPLSFTTIRRRGAGYHDDILRSGGSDSRTEVSCAEPSHAAPAGSESSHTDPSRAELSSAQELPAASAKAIRRLLVEQASPEAFSGLLPPSVLALMRDESAVPVFSDDFSSMLNYRILTASDREIAAAADMTPEMASRLRKDALCPGAFEERVRALKTRQLTYTRVSRALLHLLLDIREEQTEHFKQIGYAPYARVLGFRKSALPLLSELKKRSRIPLVTKLADAPALLEEDALAMLNREIAASHLYQLAAAQKGGVFQNEYTRQIVIL